MAVVTKLVWLLQYLTAQAVVLHVVQAVVLTLAHVVQTVVVLVHGVHVAAAAQALAEHLVAQAAEHTLALVVLHADQAVVQLVELLTLHTHLATLHVVQAVVLHADQAAELTLAHAVQAVVAVHLTQLQFTQTQCQ